MIIKNIRVLVERVESSTGAPSEITIRSFFSLLKFNLLYAHESASPSIFSLSRPSLRTKPRFFLQLDHLQSASL